MRTSENLMVLIPLPVVILPLIYSGSLFMSDMAARGSPQLATKKKQHCTLSQLMENMGNFKVQESKQQLHFASSFSNCMDPCVSN